MEEVIREPNAPPSFSQILARYSDIYAIVSPPRCSSTAFARVLWEQPSVRFYCHEPFEVTYYMGQDLPEVEAKLAAPLDLEDLKAYRGTHECRALVIKEMPYQVGRNFPLLASITDKPLIFLMRDPRLSIASRMEKKVEVGDSPFFPRIESGWELWSQQIDWCRAEGREHMLVDSTDYRDHPLEIFPQVCDRLGLPFTPEMLEWRPCPDVELDNLGGRHRHLYGAVLESSGIKPADEEVPPLDFFPEEDGWREHVERCLAIYEEYGQAAERIRPEVGAYSGAGADRASSTAGR